MTYAELQKKHQDEINSFPIIWAFNDEQLVEGMEKMGIDPKTEQKNLIRISCGGIIRKTDLAEYKEMLERHREESMRARQKPEYCYQMFLKEMKNHEYGYAGDLEEILSACGISLDILKESRMLRQALNRAHRKFFQWDLDFERMR